MCETDFHQAFKELVLFEGLEDNDPDDLGGHTFMGISRRYHPDWEGWKYVDNKDYGTATVLAKEFYRENYWRDDLPQWVRKKYFNLAVLLGHKRTTEVIQKALNSYLGLNLEIDGILGKRTKSALELVEKYRGEAKALAWIRYHAMKLLEKLAVGKQAKWKMGWIIRALY